MSTLRKIVVRGGHGHYDEGIADSANCFPGMIVELKTNGHYDLCASTKAESVKRRAIKIVRENQYQGKTTADAYASGDNLFMYTPVQGDHVLAYVKSGENIAVGDKLVEEGGGSGKFVEAAGTEAAYRLLALESTGGALGADGLVLCEVL